MKMFINARGGLAGDMFSAALIDAGAGKDTVTNAMLAAAQSLGRASVIHVKTADGASRLLIEVEHHHGHLSSHKAIHLLEHLFEDFNIEPAYATFGFNMLKALITAEAKAHAQHDFNMDTHHFHHHAGHEHDHPHPHSHDHHSHDEDAKVHRHHHHYHHDLYQQPEAWLHEAQDILIDIMGAVVGLQSLKAPLKAMLSTPVSYGGGSISFSHGTLKVPAPATQVMIDDNHIPVAAGPIDTELFTPTGAALLTALAAFNTAELPHAEPIYHGKSRGTKDLPVPPLEIMIFE
jgi:hypothetical protein